MSMNGKLDDGSVLWDHGDYYDLDALATNAETVTAQVAYVLRMLNRTRAEIKEQQRKTELHDQLVAEVGELKEQLKHAQHASDDTGAALGLARDALNAWLHDEVPATATLNALATLLNIASEQ